MSKALWLILLQIVLLLSEFVQLSKLSRLSKINELGDMRKALSADHFRALLRISRLLFIRRKIWYGKKEDVRSPSRPRPPGTSICSSKTSHPGPRYDAGCFDESAPVVVFIPLLGR
jgi:hypothetical protein